MYVLHQKDWTYDYRLQQEKKLCDACLIEKRHTLKQTQDSENGLTASILGEKDGPGDNATVQQTHLSEVLQHQIQDPPIS